MIEDHALRTTHPPTTAERIAQIAGDDAGLRALIDRLVDGLIKAGLQVTLATAA